MCRGCGDRYFETHERPDMTETMAALAEQIAQADTDDALTYGALHIVIGDWNLEAEHIEWCLAQQDAPRPVNEVEREVGEALLALSHAERYAVMDRAEERTFELYRASHGLPTA